MRINGIKNDVNQIKKWESKTKRKDLKNNAKKKKCTYYFQQHKTIRRFGESVYTCKARKVETKEDQGNLL